MRKKYYLFSFLMCCTLFCAAQKHDTLQTVRVLSQKEINPATTTIPVQVLNKEMLSRINSLSVAEAVEYFSGVTVKDYGGIGGLKTVSVRSLGANHTGVLYDGLLLGNAQGGQVDLGKFSVDNIREIELYTGGLNNIFAPARAFSIASLLALKTNGGVFDAGEKQSCSIGFKQGSFGFINPSVSAKKLIGRKIQMSIDGNFEYAKGNYFFISYDNSHADEKRNNSDISAYRAEYNFLYRPADSNEIRFKAYYYRSKRGLPGSIVLYNTIATQRLNDENFFLQSNWQKYLSSKSRLLFGAKFSNDISCYADPSYLNSYHLLINDFHQQEIYLTGAYQYNFTKALSSSFSSDFFYSTLGRTDMFAAGFAAPNRNSFLNNIALQYRKKYLEINSNFLYTVINEKVKTGIPGRDLHRPAESISISVQPFKKIPIRFRSFYQHIFRAPTFNELYYTNVGNTNLRPEQADRYDFGITFNAAEFAFLNSMVFTTDAYLETAKDKILAVPRFNLFQWSEENIGIVRAKGIDAALHLHFKDLGAFRITSDLSYSFQEALDISNKTAPEYKKQLPYTPKHSGSLNMSISYKQYGFSWNIVGSSYRYRAGDQIPENLVQGWSAHDISFSRLFEKAKNADYRITAELNNVFNTQYEIVKYYPMPRFNYRIGIIASFKKLKQS